MKFRIKEIIYSDGSSKFYVQKRFLYIFWKNVKAEVGGTCLDDEFILHITEPSQKVITKNFNVALNICKWLNHPNRKIFIDYLTDTYYFGFPIDTKSIFGTWLAYFDYNFAVNKENSIRIEQKQKVDIKTKTVIHKIHKL